MREVIGEKTLENNLQVGGVQEVGGSGSVLISVVAPHV